MTAVTAFPQCVGLIVWQRLTVVNARRCSLLSTLIRLIVTSVTFFNRYFDVAFHSLHL